MTENRLEEIEIKIAYQEDMVQELNKVVCQQQKKIDQLEETCKLLINHIQDLSGQATEQGVINDRPPHY